MLCDACELKLQDVAYEMPIVIEHIEIGDVVVVASIDVVPRVIVQEINLSIPWD